MSANVEIMLDKKENVLVVPTTAIHGTTARKSVQVYENGTTRSVQVEVGISDGKQTEIVSGVEEGEQVVMARYTAQTAS